MQKSNDHTDRTWLEEHYIEQKKTTVEIAAICGVSHKTVSRWMHKLGVPIRGNRESQRISNRRRSMLTDIRDYTDSSQ